MSNEVSDVRVNYTGDRRNNTTLGMVISGALQVSARETHGRDRAGKVEPGFKSKHSWLRHHAGLLVPKFIGILPCSVGSVVPQAEGPQTAFCLFFPALLRYI